MSRLEITVWCSAANAAIPLLIGEPGVGMSPVPTPDGVPGSCREPEPSSSVTMVASRSNRDRCGGRKW